MVYHTDVSVEKFTDTDCEFVDNLHIHSSNVAKTMMCRLTLVRSYQRAPGPKFCLCVRTGKLFINTKQMYARVSEFHHLLR